MPDINAINEHIQRQLRARDEERTSAVEAGQWLDEAGLLVDSRQRPGKPLRDLLRARLVWGQEQQSNGRWVIHRIGVSPQGSVQPDDAREPRWWWVNQGKTYEDEHSAGYIWAPLSTSTGLRPQHWVNVERAAPADRIFHYSRGAIRAVSQVTALPRVARRPSGRRITEAENLGTLVECKYMLLDDPIELTAIPIELKKGSQGPFDRRGHVKQGYLFPVDDSFVQRIELAFAGSWPRNGPLSNQIPVTPRRTVSKARPVSKVASSGAVAAPNPAAPSKSGEAAASAVARDVALIPSPSAGSIKDLVVQGESSVLEYKESARWNRRKGDRDKVLEDVIVKTVAGFMNSRLGGTLLVGVNDEGRPVGLVQDYRTISKKPNRDGYENWLTDLLTHSIGPAATARIRVSFEMVDGHDVCRLDVATGETPTFVNEITFYVRINNSTRELTGPHMLQYIKERWPGW